MRAADLQASIEYWAGEIAIKGAQAQDQGLDQVAEKFGARFKELDYARQLVTDARKVLYHLP
jgi:hypothetical protein